MGTCCGKEDEDFHYEQELLSDYVPRSVEISRSNLRSHIGLSEKDKHSSEFTSVRRDAHYVEKLVDGSSTKNTVWEWFCAVVKQHGQDRCLAQIIPGKNKKRPQYHYSTYNEIHSDASQLGRALCDLGVRNGAAVAVMSEARPEVFISTLACASQGLVVVPVYANAGIDYLHNVLKQTQCQAIIASPDAVSTITAACQQDGGSLKLEYLVEILSPFIHSISRLPEAVEAEHKHDCGVTVTTFDYLIARGRQSLRPVASRTRQDPFAILPTAGTEGPPKCIEHSEGSFVACLSALSTSGLITPHDLHLCCLSPAYPPSFSFAMHCLVSGASVLCCEPDQALTTIKRNKPTVILGRNDLFQQLHQRLLMAVGKLSFMSKWRAKKKIMARSFRMRRGQPLFKSHDKTVFSEVQSALGLRDCRVMIHCGGTLPPKALEELRTWVNPTQGVLQSYGSAETCGFLSLSGSNDHTTMHVGSPLPCFEVRLKDCAHLGYSIHQEYQHGELQCRGPGLFVSPDSDPEHWHSTGDVVRLNPNGTITFIDRVRSIRESKLGSFVPLGKLERSIAACDWVQQVFLHLYESTDSAFLVLLPELSWVIDTAKARGWHFNRKHLNKPGRLAAECSAILKDPIHRADLSLLARENVVGVLERATRGPERIIKINVVGVFLLSVEGFADCATPSGTLKRLVATDRFRGEIEAIRITIPKPKQFSISMTHDSMSTPLLSSQSSS